jgi:hypothetical protein
VFESIVSTTNNFKLSYEQSRLEQLVCVLALESSSGRDAYSKGETVFLAVPL